MTSEGSRLVIRPATVADLPALVAMRDRLNDLVRRSGILVFASHSDEFLMELCDTGVWMEEGRIRLAGSLREVIAGYKGRDPYENMSTETMRRLGIEHALPTGGEDSKTRVSVAPGEAEG